jgi:heat shock protein HslJ
MNKIFIFFVSALICGGCSSSANIQKHSLNGSWVMQRMTGVSLNKDELAKGLPVFSFDLTEKRFSGHAGCNQLSSGIEVTDNEITFNLFIGTKMACPDMSVEDAVIKTLSGNTLHYEFNDDELILTSPDGIAMHFVKEE